MDAFLHAAIAEAELGASEGGIPIGSVLVHDGTIIGRGHNRRVQQGSTVLHEGPFIAKVISTCLAIAANYVGNRYWTFGATKRDQVVREGVEFVVVSLGGMLITLACLWISHYGLGFTSVLADNIAGNVIGLGLGTVFRFAFYRYWVFHPSRSMPLRSAEGAVVPPGGAPRDGVEAVAAVDDRAGAHD